MTEAERLIDYIRHAELNAQVVERVRTLHRTVEVCPETGALWDDTLDPDLDPCDHLAEHLIVCAECCCAPFDDGLWQTEYCADNHDHHENKPICTTVQVLDQQPSLTVV